MNSIYVHIPFCPRRCSYCDFFSTTSLHKQKQYIDAVCLELKQRQDYLLSRKIDTIYLGGGTPSTLHPDLLSKLFDTLDNLFDLSELLECTIECNPDDIQADYLQALKHMPINRISMGVQSFNDDELKLMNRRHHAQQAIDAVYQIVDAGFTNCSIDLIYGLPNQSVENWKYNLKTALSLPIKHVSAYHLTYEKTTPMYAYLNQAVSEETSCLFFELLHQYTQEAGMQAYEISNFCLPGYESKHNSNYWKNQPYLGVGAAAHSYNQKERCWNVASLDDYINGIEQNKLVVETELLSDDDLYNELILTSLRTKEGIDTSKIHPKYRTYFTKQCQKHLQNKTLEQNTTHTYLTPKGIFISDGIICDLMV